MNPRGANNGTDGNGNGNRLWPFIRRHALKVIVSFVILGALSAVCKLVANAADNYTQHFATKEDIKSCASKGDLQSVTNILNANEKRHAEDLQHTNAQLEDLRHGNATIEQIKSKQVELEKQVAVMANQAQNDSERTKRIESDVKEIRRLLETRN